MNKKYLSVILFGALMLGTTGTFTSCKDYDDDINQINKELTDIKSAISELQSKVDNGKYVTNITKEGEGIKITWNDNSTSVIETIKGDKGADGTIVTIIDGYWAFDGVKSEYPAVGKDGADGQDGQNGQDGHDAKISEDGYWMVWDAEKGEYTKTEYIAGGVTAVATAGGWNLTVRDENGDVQTIFIPTSSTMGYIDVLGNDVADYPTPYDLTSMKALYGINEKDVEYGPADAKKTLQKGLYTTLDRDLMIVVNPQGTDASDYTFALMNSANVNTGLLFKDAVPYEGVLSRATSANGVWVLPHDFTRYEDIDDARTKNYLLFKANDGAKHALSLTATLNNTTVKTPYDLGASLKKIGTVSVYVNNLTNCAVNKEYVPTYAANSIDANAVYDYWLTFEQSADNLKYVELYGAKIVNDGHAFTYTKESGVNNNIKLVYNYILMDGTVVQGDKAPIFYALMREEMATEHTVTLDRLNVPMDAEYIDGKDNKELTPIDYWVWSNNGKKVFALNTEAYPLSSLLADMSDVEKAVWNSAIANNSVELTVIGGEGDNNQYNDNDDMGHNVRYAVDTKNNTITFQFCVSEGYPYNFRLNNAYQLTLTVNDQDTGTPVASIILPFEFTQPTLDITRVNGEKALWNDKKNVLSMYGDKVMDEGLVAMHVPFHEAFTTAYAKQYTAFTQTAEYYTLSCNADVLDAGFNYWGYKVMGHNFLDLANAPLTDIISSAQAAEWNTSTVNNAIGLGIPVKADYTFYGVYPATDEQVSDFTLRFASLLGDATSVKANGEFTSNNVTREVILTDANFTLTDALGDTFYLFDGVKSDGNVDKRSDMNLRQGFEEGTEGFETDFTLATTGIKAYYYKNGSKVNIPVTVGVENTNATLVSNTNTKTRAWEPGTISATDVIVTDLPAAEAVKSAGYAAIPGGVMIQLPSSIGTTEPVTIEFDLIDVFGVTKTLSVTVKAAK